MSIFSCLKRNDSQTFKSRPKCNLNFFLCLKRNGPQTFKSCSCEKLFDIHVIDTTLLRWMLLIPFDNWESMFFVNVCRNLRFFQPPYCCVLWKSVLKEVFILRYLHNIIAVLIPKFQNKAIYILYLINFRNLLWLPFYTLYFVTAPHFSYDFFFQKLFVTACFLRNRIFINSLVSFYKENKITELFKGAL